MKSAALGGLFIAACSLAVDEEYVFEPAREAPDALRSPSGAGAGGAPGDPSPPGAGAPSTLARDSGSNIAADGADASAPARDGGDNVASDGADASAPGCSATAPCGCNSDADCPALGTCSAGVCGAGSVCAQRPVDFGVPVDSPLGDCRTRRCDGKGGVEEIADDDDLPADPGGGCWRPTCSAGELTQTPRPAGVACGEGATECSDVDRCDGAGACAPHHLVGSVIRAATASDCRARICDASGRAVETPTAAACDDGQYCTGTESCSSDGACTSSGNPCPSGNAGCADACNEAADSCTANDLRGSSCGGSNRCDGAGACRQCLGSGECPIETPVCAASGSCVECVEDVDCQGRLTSPTCFRPACRNNGCVNVVNVNARCGNASDTECDNPDICGPDGECLPNYEGGGSCGEPNRGCSCDSNGPTCRC